MPGERRRTAYMPLADVLRAPRNPKRHRADIIAGSMDRFGVVELPALDERTGRLVAGHGRLDDWARRRDSGEQPPEGIDLDPVTGDWLVPVTRGWASRSDADAEGYLIVSNRSTELGGYDGEELATVLLDLRNTDADLLALTGYDDADLDALLTETGVGDTSGGDPWDHATDIDDQEPPDDPVTKPGDVWILGPHRLLCGSSTDPANLPRVLGDTAPVVVHTDPPYGISVVQRSSVMSKGGPQSVGGIRAANGEPIHSTKFRPVLGDEDATVVTDAFALLYGTYPDAAHVWWGGNHYAASAGLPDASRWLVWDKQNGTNDFADCELAWTNQRGPVRMLTHMWNGMLRATERGKRVHPNQKPVALIVWALDLVDPKKADGLVFDGFGGSGSTLLACDQTGRRAALIELDPGYCDVICRRYQDTTGTRPVREADGQAIDFTEAAP